MWAGAGASLVGGLFGMGGSAISSAWAAKEAKKNRKFQERMSSSAHQRQVKDLRRAGLNPILAANKGASTPGGSAAQIHDMGRAGAAGASMALIAAQIRNTHASTAKVEAETDVIEAQTPKRLVHGRAYNKVLEIMDEAEALRRDGFQYPQGTGKTQRKHKARYGKYGYPVEMNKRKDRR